MEKILYKLENFEGPLDLLLHLITKNKVSIYDIPIVEITDQYMEYIEGVEEMELEGASEFLVMAAQLLYIKSRLLLPRPEEEDEEDPREDLAQRLAEYQKYKMAAETLRESEFWSEYMVFREPEKIEFPIPEYDGQHSVIELITAFHDIFSRKERKMPPPKRSFAGIVGREKVSVEDMVEKVCKLLVRHKYLTFQSIFRPEDSKPEMIATFLAVLEMIKLNRIRADFDEDKQDFMIHKAA
jgi:segregation and condensation protein A